MRNRPVLPLLPLGKVKRCVVIHNSLTQIIPLLPQISVFEISKAE
jgi:hypothetical protein